MRELKFRAWVPENKSFVEATLVGDRLDIRIMPIEEGTILNPQIEWGWLQFTGLRDKNGVEIYEGDVVKTNFSNSIPGVVDFLFAEFVITKGSWVDSLTNLTRNHWTLEVIGNIYENPELAKGEKEWD